MSDVPSQYPLLGSTPNYDTKLADPSAKLVDSWLQESYLPFSLTSVSAVPSRESRKRFRAGLDADGPSPTDLAVQVREPDSGDEMIITDTESGADDISHASKRRLTVTLGDLLGRNLARILNLQLAHPPSIPSAVSLPSATSTLAVPIEKDQVHPCTPSGMEESLTTTPVSDIDEQNPQQLVLPLPLASPVQSVTDKPSVHEELERQLLKVPNTQAELIDLLLNLSSYVLEANRNNLVFGLLQHVGRLLLLSLCGIIQDSLRRDILLSLPLEVLLNILSYLDAKSVLAVSLVCRRWLRLVNNTTLWRNMLIRDKLVTDELHLYYELVNPAKLFAEWASPSPYLSELNVAQILYKKRSIILRRWMDPKYEPSRISVAGHGSNIVTCLHHDEEKVITGIEGKLINVHSTKTGELLRVLKGHDGGVWALKYFSNTLVSGSTDREVRVWNIRTGRCTHVFRGHTSTVRCMDILHPAKIGVNDNGLPIMYPKEPLLVTGSRDHNLHVWKLPLDNEDVGADEITETKTYDAKDPSNPYIVAILTGHTQSVRSVTGYGNIIVSGSYDTTVRVWDLLEGGRCKHVLEGHSDKIYSTALNFEKRRCYSGSMDLSINVWDFEKGKLLFSLEGHNSLVGLLELSDGYLVSAAADATLRVWDPVTGENHSKLKGHNSAITCFQHDSLRIVSGSERMLKLWDIKTGRFVRDLLTDITGGIWQVSFDPDRCVAAVQKHKNDAEETYIEILDFSTPLNGPSNFNSNLSLPAPMEI
ncbi:CIC11C00000001926 [Sungouiella intermedia]|uniref:CIC11C00000001926 n=1 Tax=Sungouiella intermedia TaxID=45354 RepID=A0A1L0D656_9ASCO|nr:CIC11C00000001926 [[Candida] intermedia]